MTQRQFTIVMPVHNGEAYLETALQSLAEQTYPYFELLVLENTSTDRTIEILNHVTQFAVRIESSKTLMTIEQNWARILSISASEFIVLMCDDDILYPRFLESINSLIDAHPQATLYHTHAVFIDEHNNVVEDSKPALPQESAEDYLRRLHNGQEDVFGTGFVMRLADFQHIGGYPDFKRLLFADFYCYFRLTQLGYKACATDKLVGFRRNAQGVTGTSPPKDFITAAQQYRDRLRHDGVLNHPADQDLLDEFLQRFLMLRYRLYLFAFIRQQTPRDLQAFDETYQLLQSTWTLPERIYPFDVPLSWYLKIARQPGVVIRVGLLSLFLAWIQLRRKLGEM